MNPATDYNNRAEPWIGVDLDRTLAHYTHWVAADSIGAPITPMLELVKKLLAAGEKVRIFTARVWHDGSPEMFDRSELARTAIRRWCKQHLGVELPITCVKDLGCTLLLDDIARQVIPNQGLVVEWYSDGIVGEKGA